MTPKNSNNFTSENIGEAVQQEETLYDEVETVWVSTYLGDRVSAGGGSCCECQNKMWVG